jgi:Fis family transcriptional regulator
VAKKKKKVSSVKKASGDNKELLANVRNRPLRDLTEEALHRYFKDLNGDKPFGLYDLVLGEVEAPLFKSVMDYTDGNQSHAAQVLGINRATLRKKLKHYYLLD